MPNDLARFLSRACRRYGPLRDGFLAAWIHYDFKIGHIEVTDNTMQMPPDLILVEANTGKKIAVEIQCPNLDRVQLQAQTVTRLMKRMAVLKLGFHDAVLVMPVGSAPVAEAMVDRWRAWTRQDTSSKNELIISLLSNL